MDDNAKELNIFDRIHKDIKKFKEKGCIIKIFEPDPNPRIVNIEDICQQPIEGLLYDLNLEEAFLATIHKDDPLIFADKMAISSVLTFLHKFYMENKNKPKD